jgi:CPA1 family monovalent cation:H+ antiporter
MNLFDITSILLTMAALCSFINIKFFKLPNAIGLLLFAMGIGFLGIILNGAGWITNEYVDHFLSSINFKETVFHGMLSFLLFAGALQIKIEDLKKSQLPIFITSTLSTALSAVLIGAAFFILSHYAGFSQITLLDAMLLGTILSPTDPIAILSIIHKMGISKKLETMIVGESLFNDGVAIVMFVGLLEMLNAHTNGSATNIVLLFFMEAGGGIACGLVLGWVANQLLCRSNHYQLILLIHLAIATGGYTLADKLHFSAPLAMVVAGIIVGNLKHSTSTAAEEIKKYIDAFWKAIDDILNAVLFLLIGLEMMVIHLTPAMGLLGVACIFIALLARLISLAIPLTLLQPVYSTRPGTMLILTWGGLRGALSIAMVLSLPSPDLKLIFLPCVYLVVVFAIAVQGLTFDRLLRYYQKPRLNPI